MFFSVSNIHSNLYVKNCTPFYITSVIKAGIVYVSLRLSGHDAQPSKENNNFLVYGWRKWVLSSAE